MNRTRFLLTAALLWSCSGGFATAAHAPAMWLVQSPTAKVYLFGTIHVMKPSAVWSTPAIDTAMAKSDDLWLEVPDDLKDPSAILPQVQTLGMDPSHPLSTKISKADLDRLDAAFKAGGLPGEAPFEAFRPWLAGLMVSLLPAMKAGYSGTSGIDASLRSTMTAAGKPVKGFETVSDQLHFFADLTQPQEVAFLHETLAASAAGEAKTREPSIDKIASLWQSGDIAGAAALESHMDAMDPSLTELLVTKRNTNWAKQLDTRLHGSGTSFIAVGLLHLVGTGSLIDDLSKLGYTVTRVE